MAKPPTDFVDRVLLIESRWREMVGARFGVPDDAGTVPPPIVTVHYGTPKSTL